MQKLENVTPNLILQNNLHWKFNIYLLINENINYLQSKSDGKCVTHVKFSHMKIFFYQMLNISKTLNVLLTPHVSSIVVHFD